MKIILILLGLMIVNMNSIAEQTNRSAYYRKLVQQIEAEAWKSRIRDEVGFVDAYFFLGKQEPYISFQKEMATSSEFVLAHLDEIASTEYQRAIVVMSTWQMRRETFVEFLNAMADLVEAEKLDGKFFKWAQNPTESHLSGLLVREYAEPDIQNIIMRSRKIFHNQPTLLVQYDSMLTGESQRKLDQFEKAVREGQSLGTNLTAGLTIRKTVNKRTTKMEFATGTEAISISSVSPFKEELDRGIPTERDYPEKQTSGFVFLVFLGVLFVLAYVGLRIFRRR